MTPKTEHKRIVRWAIGQDWSAVVPTRRLFDKGRALVELLWHEGEFQVERVTVVPHAHIPPHRHLFADSWEVHLAGSGSAMIGKRAFRIGSTNRFPAIWIPRNVWHGGDAGPVGGCWLSVQRWYESPRSLADDWQERKTDGPEQAKRS
jgi:quercetin dioxygenase-like cupin family protein